MGWDGACRAVALARVIFPMPPRLSRRAALELIGVGMAGYVCPGLCGCGAGCRQDAHRAHRRVPGALSDAGAVQVLRGPRRLADRTSGGARPHHRRQRRRGLGRERADPEVERRDARDGVDAPSPAYLAPELIGRDPADIAGAHAVMNRAIAPAFSTGQPIAKSGIDLALHDLVGAPARASRHRALGPRAWRAADAQLDGEPAHARRDRDARRRRARARATGTST